MMTTSRGTAPLAADMMSATSSNFSVPTASCVSSDGRGEADSCSEQDNIVRWYVLITHNMMFEQSVSFLSREFGTENVFTLKVKDVVNRNGQLVKTDQAYALRTLLFARASINHIKQARLRLKAGRDTVPFRFYLSRLHNLPNERLFISDIEMEHFITTYECIDRAPQLVMFKDLPALKPNQQVRIVNGPLKGVCGYFMQIKRGQKRRFVATLQNFAAVVAKLDDNELMEIITEE